MVYLKFSKPNYVIVRTEGNGSHWEMIDQEAVKIGRRRKGRDGEVPGCISFFSAPLLLFGYPFVLLCPLNDFMASYLFSRYTSFSLSENSSTTSFLLGSGVQMLSPKAAK